MPETIVSQINIQPVFRFHFNRLIFGNAVQNTCNTQVVERELSISAGDQGWVRIPVDQAGALLECIRRAVDHYKNSGQ